VDLEEVERHWWHGHHHDAAEMQRYMSDGIRTAADYFEQAVDSSPDRPFLISVETESILTYRECDQLANQVAHWIHSAGVRAGDVVALMMENQPRFVATWLGLAKAGATVACINTNLSEGLLEHALQLAGAAHVVVGEECLSKWRESSARELSVPGNDGGAPVPITCWVARSDFVSPAKSAVDALGGGSGELWLDEALGRQSTARPPLAWRAPVTPSDSVFFIYTSGTTGKSKAARFTHKRFIGAGVTWQRHMQLVASDRYYVTLPLYHGNGGVVAVSAAIRAGCTLVVRRKFSASNFLRDVRHFGCTATIYIGELWRYVHNQAAREDDADNPLRVVAGNGLRADIWQSVVRRFGIAKVVEHYGQTEMPSAHPMINSYNVAGACGFIPLSVRGAMGTEKLVRYDVHQDAVYRNAEGRCEPVGPGEPGEAIVKLDGPYAGYTSDEATSKVIYRDVFEPGDRWYHSGDLLRFDSYGFIYFVDRAGDSFRWKGENVSTNEVCEVLGRCSAVAEANVYGVRVPHTDGRIGMASVLAAPKLPLDEVLRSVYHHVEEHLPVYARPAFLRMRSRENEKTATFKFQKFRFVEEGFDPTRVARSAPGDRLFYRDPRAEAYVPLTDELVSALNGGLVRL